MMRVLGWHDLINPATAASVIVGNDTCINNEGLFVESPSSSSLIRAPSDAAVRLTFHEFHIKNQRC